MRLTGPPGWSGITAMNRAWTLEFETFGLYKYTFIPDHYTWMLLNIVGGRADSYPVFGHKKTFRLVVGPTTFGRFFLFSHSITRWNDSLYFFGSIYRLRRLK